MGTIHVLLGALCLSICINECVSQVSFPSYAKACSDCNLNAVCEKKTGYVKCSCKDGLVGDGLNCTKIVFCGSTTCCPPGYTWNMVSKTCQDVDECASTSTVNKCVPKGNCINKNGIFLCSSAASPLCSCEASEDCMNIGDIVKCADPCLHYQELNGNSRLYTVDSTGRFSTDRYNFGWYRYKDNLRIKEGCVGMLKCGSLQPLTLGASPPAIGDGIRRVPLTINSLSGCVNGSTIPVKACPGNFYVYKFSGMLAYDVYCTEIPPITTTSSTTLTTTSSTTPTTPSTTATTTTTPSTTPTTITTPSTTPTTPSTTPTTPSTIPTTPSTTPTTPSTTPTTPSTIPTTPSTTPTTPSTIPTSTPSTIPITPSTIPTTPSTTPTTMTPTTTPTTPFTTPTTPSTIPTTPSTIPTSPSTTPTTPSTTDITTNTPSTTPTTVTPSTTPTTPSTIPTSPSTAPTTLSTSPNTTPSTAHITTTTPSTTPATTFNSTETCTNNSVTPVTIPASTVISVDNITVTHVRSKSTLTVRILTQTVNGKKVKSLEINETTVVQIEMKTITPTHILTKITNSVSPTSLLVTVGTDDPEAVTERPETVVTSNETTIPNTDVFKPDSYCSQPARTNTITESSTIAGNTCSEVTSATMTTTITTTEEIIVLGPNGFSSSCTKY